MPEGVWGLTGSKRGTPFRRAGVSHRPDVRARARGTRRHAVFAIGKARCIRKRLQRAEQFNVLLGTEQLRNVLLRTR